MKTYKWFGQDDFRNEGMQASDLVLSEDDARWDNIPTLAEVELARTALLGMDAGSYLAIDDSPTIGQEQGPYTSYF